MEIDCFYCFIAFLFFIRFVVAGDAMLNATMESSSGSYQYDKHLGINKTMVNTLNHLPFYRAKDRAAYRATVIQTLLCTV